MRSSFSAINSVCSFFNAISFILLLKFWFSLNNLLCLIAKVLIIDFIPSKYFWVSSFSLDANNAVEALPLVLISFIKSATYTLIVSIFNNLSDTTLLFSILL